MSITEKKAQQASRPHVPAWLSTLAAHPLAVPLLLAAILIVYFFPVLSGSMHFWEDLVYFDLPNRVFNRDAILSGQFPFWNPYAFGGMPFFATFQTGSLYIYNILLSVLPVSNATLWYLIELGLIVHLWVGGMGMYFLARTFERSRSAALFAAIAFMLSGFLMLHLIHAMMVIIVSLTPLVMALLLKGCRTGSLRHFGLAGLVLGGSIFAGHPQLTLYQFLFLGFFCLYLLFSTPGHRLRLTSGMALSFGGAALLCLVQLLPAMELVAHTVRNNWTFEAISEGSLSFRQLITFLIPKLFGGMSMKQGELPFWLQDSFHSGYWTFWETGFYLGIVPLLLGIVYLSRTYKEPMSRFVLMWMMVSLLTALGSHTPFFKLLYDFVPGFDKFRIPSRILFSWTVLFPLLGAFVLDRWRNRELARTDSLMALTIGSAAALPAFFVLSGMARSWWQELAMDSTRAHFAQQQTVGYLFILLSAAAIVALYLRRKLSFAQFAPLLVVLTILDLSIFSKGYHLIPTSPTTYLERYEQAAQFFREASSRELMRVKGREGGALLMDRNQGMIDKIYTLEGYSQLNLFRKVPPVAERTQLDLLNVRYAIQVDYASNTMGLAKNPTAFERFSLFYRAKSFDDDSALVRYMRSEQYNHQSEVVLEKAVALPALLDSAPAPQGRVLIDRYSLNAIELSVTTSQPAVLLLSEIFYPDWQARVDKQPVEILRANYCLRAIALTAGTHKVSVRYQSAAFIKGLVASSVGLVLLLVFSLAGDRLFALPQVQREHKA